jgi:hypothetical protein
MNNKFSFFKRFSYLMYYIKQLDKKKFSLFLNHVSKTTGRSKAGILSDAVSCIFKYNIGLMDYFIFKFYEKDSKQREQWGGTGFLYEYHLLMNPKNTRHILANKIDFFEAYAPFVHHANCTIDDLEKNNSKAQAVLNNSKNKIVVKDALGQCGWDVEVLTASDYTAQSLFKYMNSKGFNLIEEFVEQHPDLKLLSATGLNTVRIITQLNKNNEVEILGARLRISVNSHVDNLASGNIAAPVNIQTGRVEGPAVYSDITKSEAASHPVTGIKIEGFQVPLWAESIEMVKKAAHHRPENRSIGWDVAITAQGPELIEGNHNWCKILWQLPVKQGLKNTLYQYV